MTKKVVAVKSRNLQPKRFNALREDSSVGSAKETIEKLLELPRGSVVLLLPSGDKAKSNKKIKSLRSDWNKYFASKS